MCVCKVGVWMDDFGYRTFGVFCGVRCVRINQCEDTCAGEYADMAMNESFRLFFGLRCKFPIFFYQGQCVLNEFTEHESAITGTSITILLNNQTSS